MKVLINSFPLRHACEIGDIKSVKEILSSSDVNNIAMRNVVSLAFERLDSKLLDVLLSSDKLYEGNWRDWLKDKLLNALIKNEENIVRTAMTNNNIIEKLGNDKMRNKVTILETIIEGCIYCNFTATIDEMVRVYKFNDKDLMTFFQYVANDEVVPNREYMFTELAKHLTDKGLDKVIKELQNGYPLIQTFISNFKLNQKLSERLIVADKTKKLRNKI